MYLRRTLRGFVADGASGSRRSDDSSGEAWPSSGVSPGDLEDLFENASVGIHFETEDGIIVAANRAVLDLLGYSGDEYIGHNINEFHADRVALDGAIADLKAGETVRGFATQMVCKDGTLRDVSIESSVKRTSDGRFLHTRCFTHDVGDRVRGEEVSFRLATIVESSDDAIVSKNLDGIIQSWNTAAERIFGYTAEEVIGKSIRLIVPDDRQAEEDDVLRSVREGRRIDHFDTVRLRKDGSLVDISLTVSPVRDHVGRIIGASKVARDVTTRKLAEQALHESITAKEEFLSLVSHELRTPVAVLVGVARILRQRFQSLSDEERQQAFVDLDSHAARLQEIIEHLLILTRLTSGASLEFEPVRIERLAASLIDGYKRRYPALTIAVSAASHLPISSVNPSLIELVMDNLISNAVKYSSGPVEIACSLPGSGQIAVDVLDRGIGLGESEANAVFEAFYRSKTARDTAPGMGLGLAVCKKVVEAHGGTITAHARPGGGARFRFTVPALTAD